MALNPLDTECTKTPYKTRALQSIPVWRTSLCSADSVVTKNEDGHFGLDVNSRSNQVNFIYIVRYHKSQICLEELDNLYNIRPSIGMREELLPKTV